MPSPEIWFYHLETRTLEQALPELLERCLQRDWRVYIHVADEDQLSALNAWLWAYAPQSFLAHGLENDPHPDLQPVLLGAGSGMLNQPDVYLSVAPVNLPDSESMNGLQRGLVLFAGHDEDHLGWARNLWKQLKGQGYALAYWKQNEQGRWEKLQ